LTTETKLLAKHTDTVFKITFTFVSIIFFAAAVGIVVVGFKFFLGNI